jgi:CheY-like chemotaxis protein
MKKILVIEDEKGEILMLKNRLEDNGYTVITATDGEEGIKKVYEESPDLIILDIVLPIMNGYEVCCHLKKDPKTQNLPIIVITAYGAEALEKECIALGIEESLQKPYDSSDLLKRIAFHLKKC